MHYIFDLDGTVIDSTHRQNTLADGSLNLSEWRKNNTFNKIQNDSVMPLAKFWRDAVAAGHTVAICTARTLGIGDYTFLRNNNLFAHVVFSRPEGNKQADHDLKSEQLLDWIIEEGIETVEMFDDNKKVRAAVSGLGIVMHDPDEYNQNHD